jgi:NADH dehydrogenase (ubiquinone) Fe-S protein 2
MDSHTVEELHSMSAEEILKEGGTRKEASMRHFTVNFGWVDLNLLCSVGQSG